MEESPFNPTKMGQREPLGDDGIKWLRQQGLLEPLVKGLRMKNESELKRLHWAVLRAWSKNDWENYLDPSYYAAYAHLLLHPAVSARTPASNDYSSLCKNDETFQFLIEGYCDVPTIEKNKFIPTAKLFPLHYSGSQEEHIFCRDAVIDLLEIFSNLNGPSTLSGTPGTGKSQVARLSVLQRVCSSRSPAVFIELDRKGLAHSFITLIRPTGLSINNVEWKQFRFNTRPGFQLLLQLPPTETFMAVDGATKETDHWAGHAMSVDGFVCSSGQVEYGAGCYLPAHKLVMPIWSLEEMALALRGTKVLQARLKTLETAEGKYEDETEENFCLRLLTKKYDLVGGSARSMFDMPATKVIYHLSEGLYMLGDEAAQKTFLGYMKPCNNLAKNRLIATAWKSTTPCKRANYDEGNRKACPVSKYVISQLRMALTPKFVADMYFWAQSTGNRSLEGWMFEEYVRKQLATREITLQLSMAGTVDQKSPIECITLTPVDTIYVLKRPNKHQLANMFLEPKLPTRSLAGLLSCWPEECNFPTIDHFMIVPKDECYFLYCFQETISENHDGRDAVLLAIWQMVKTMMPKDAPFSKKITHVAIVPTATDLKRFAFKWIHQRDTDEFHIVLKVAHFPNDPRTHTSD